MIIAQVFYQIDGAASAREVVMKVGCQWIAVHL
jgi:hypothetical protein